MWCQSRQTEHRWQLQFDVRQTAEPEEGAQVVAETIDQAQVEAAQAAVTRAFRPGAEGAALPPEQLRKTLEDILDLSKEHWPTPLIRSLADTLLDCAAGRTRTAEHEERWLNLLGFCLCPGFGDPVDEWRMKRVWKLYFDGLAFPRQTQCRTEWWIFWRRSAGGLKAGQQMELYQQVRPYCNRPDGVKPNPGRCPSMWAPANYWRSG